MDILEDFLDKHLLVMLNDGTQMRFHVVNGSVSYIDLTFASDELARCGKWDVMDGYTMEIDHFPILSRFGRVLKMVKVNFFRGFNFHIANWDMFKERL